MTSVRSARRAGHSETAWAWFARGEVESPPDGLIARRSSGDIPSTFVPKGALFEASALSTWSKNAQTAELPAGKSRSTGNHGRILTQFRSNGAVAQIS